MVGVIKRNSALDKSHQELYLTLEDSSTADIDKCCSVAYSAILALLYDEFSRLAKDKSLKIQVVFHVALEKYSFELQLTIHGDYWFPSTSHTVFSKDHAPKIVDQCIKEALLNYDSFVKNGSGWVLLKVLEVKLVIGKYHVFKGGCEKAMLPPRYRKSKSIVSPPPAKDGTPDCFVRALILALTSKTKTANKTRWSKRENSLMKKFPTKILSFPVSLKEATWFERFSPFSINIYGLSGKYKKVFPYYVSDKESGSSHLHADLLFYEDHYYTILNLGAILRRGNFKNQRKLHVCSYCLNTFSIKEQFEVHKYLCLNKLQPLKFPSDEAKVKKFDNFKHLLYAPFVIYADLESSIGKPVLNDNIHQKLKHKKVHKCIAWATYTVCEANKAFSSPSPVQYVGERAIEMLLVHLQKEFYRIRDILADVFVPIQMGSEEKHQFSNVDHCEICLQEFDNRKVRDHCHLSGTYRAALCSRCNLTFAKTFLNRVVCFFHGLSNYDSHFLIQELHRVSLAKNLKISVIPRTNEKYLSFSVGGLVFKDSYQFLGESLSKLVSNLKDKDPDLFHVTKSVFSDPKYEELIYRKGVFPYNYLTSLKVLDETSLPKKSEFFNDLTMEDVSADDYEFALKTWKICQFKTLGDYLLFYLALDVVLLADVFENFRKSCKKDYELDPLYYFSAAHYTMDAFLRQSKAEFELLTDVNQYFFCLRAIRGGVSMVSCKRLVQANNMYMQSYDPSKPSSFIIDLDANNLYGRCMMDYLPQSNFKWEDITIDLINAILETPADADKGYLLEVDLVYPVKLHDAHQDYPMAPVKLSKPFSDLSPFSQRTVEKHGLKPSCGFEKLMTTLEDKDHYILHYRNLQLYLRHGLKLKRVHRVLSFKQAPMMRDYICFNSRKRAEATNSFDTSLFKLLSNSLYGKTIERADNRTMIKLISNIQAYENFISKVTMKSSKIINPNLVALEMKHPILKVDKPVYLGCVILELAKFYMYKFHYESMKPHFGDRIKLIYTDTDSLLYEVQTKDLYNDLKSFPVGTFDFSNYPKDHLLYNETFKRVPGCFKDETNGQIIESFVGLRSKMYAIKMSDPKLSEIKVAKGVKRPVISHCLKYKNYVDCLLKLEIYQHSFHSIRSDRHQVYTYFQEKTSLSPFDDKRWILDDGINSIPYGHYHHLDLEETKSEEEK